MKSLARSPILEKLAWWSWMALLVSLPFTSAPLVVALLAWNPVSPLALLPLAALVVLWFIPYVLKGGTFSRALIPLGLFLGVSILSAVMAHANSRLPVGGEQLVREELTSLGALAVGLGFLAVASKLPDSEARLRASLRAISIGGLLTMIWSSVQATYVLTEGPRVPLSFTQLHHLFSIRDPISDRVHGFAYEPSWLGNQLMILYLPLWLGAVITGRSAFPKWRNRLSVEWLLALWGVGIFLLTRSRISFLSAAAVVFVAGLALAWKVSSRWRFRSVSRNALRAGALALGAMILLLAMLGAAWIASRVDERLSLLFDLGPRVPEIRAFYLDESGIEVANRLAFAERIVYWMAGFRTFEQSPLLGVGLGNSGWLFRENAPAYGYRLLEIAEVLDPSNPHLPNPKALWLRLLAETGMVGFAIFVVWLTLVAAMAYSLWRRATGTNKMLGLAGLFALVAQSVEGFSLDSFALPHLWITLGLVLAAYSRFRAQTALAESGDDDPAAI